MTRTFLAMLALLAATPALAQQQAQCGVTQTVIVLTAGTSAPLVGVNPQRRGLEFQNVGANSVTIAAGTTAAAGQGLVLAPGSGTPPAGGSERFFSGPTPANAFAAVSASGTTVLVWECQ